MARWISVIDRIVTHILIQIGLPTAKSERVGGGPASRLRIKIAGAEADEMRIPVVETAAKAKWLEAGIGILRHVAEFVVAQLLRDAAVGDVHDQPGASVLIGVD